MENFIGQVLKSRELGILGSCLINVSPMLKEKLKNMGYDPNDLELTLRRHNRTGKIFLVIEKFDHLTMLTTYKIEAEIN